MNAAKASAPKPYYEDGSMTIYHGDCREILPTLPEADLILADPPYGIAINTDYSRFGGVKVYAPVSGDREPFDPAHLLGGRGRVVLFGANHYADKLPVTGGWIVWDKVTANHVKTVLSDGELAWTNWLGNVRIYRHLWNGAYRATERDGFLHPTQKPVALMSWIIHMATEPSALVVDPYMGSGPTLVAARALGRRAIGIEAEERYCEIAAERLCQETFGMRFE